MLNNQEKFINKVKQGAQQGMKKYGILASLTIAQAILESGWGKSKLAVEGNNLFGIKAYGRVEYITIQTNEYVNGIKISVNTKFRKYSSWDESIEDHAKFLTENKRYHKILGIKNYKTVCNLIKQAGYATASNYDVRLITIIEQYKLYKYDTIETTKSSPNRTSSNINISIKEIQHQFNIQFKAGLIEDGIYGPKTQAAANKIIIFKGHKGKITKWIQKKVVSLGYTLPKYGIDGDFGDETKTAIIKFQRDKKLVQDGIVGPNTWRALMQS